MFGCYYNPFLFMTALSPFNYGGINMPPSNLTSPWSQVMLNNAVTASHASLGPYGWASNFGGRIQLNSYDPSLPLETVMTLQRMNYDPTYVPDFSMYNNSTAIMQQKLAEAAQRGKAEGEKEVLRIKYSVTLNSVTNFIEELTNLLKTEGLPETGKQELEQIKTKAEALKQKMEEYATTSANKKTTTAIEEVEAMLGELIELKENATATAQKIAATKQKEKIEEEKTEKQEKVEKTQKPDNTQKPAETEQPGNVENEGEIKIEDIKNNFAELKTLTDEILKEYQNDITEEDKKAIADKQKALEEAIKAEKPIEELTKLYNDLFELVTNISKNISETQSQKAIAICSDLYVAANGVDWISSNEATIKNIVFNKINENNILEVLNQWDKGNYNTNTGDSCLLETLFGEFKFNASGTKKQIANHLLSCLEKVAEKMNLSQDIQPYISVIKGEMNCTFWSYEKIYNAFNSIQAILGTITLKGE